MMSFEVPTSGSPQAGPILPPGSIFCPVGRALDLVGDRWTLVLIQHLLGGPRGFQALRVRTGIAPRVLSTRLRQLAAAGFIEAVSENGRSFYAVTDLGRSLEPIISSIARWFVSRAVKDGLVEMGRFTETSPLSILDSLPFLLREDRAQGADVTFEIRLTGMGGGVWTLHIHDGTCSIKEGFAPLADVRYTAEARVWCAVALGHMDPREAIKQGLMTKDGGRPALDQYFHQLGHPSGWVPKTHTP